MNQNATDNGPKNLITPEGFKRLSDEYQQLWNVERPSVVEVVSWAAGNGDRSENGDYIYGKRKLREIDRRLAYLGKQIHAALVIDPTQVKSEVIAFGATVRISDEEGEERTYALVGDDETDPNRGIISWRSPIGQALLRRRIGDFVSYKTPRGERSLEILEIRYIEIVTSIEPTDAK